MNGQFTVIRREAIPAHRTVEQNSETRVVGELRDFRWNSELRNFLRDVGGTSVSWAVLRHSEALKSDAYSIASMVVIYAGGGEVFGDLCRPLHTGDVLVIPAGCSHGLIGGPQGMSAVIVRLGPNSCINPDTPCIPLLEDEKALQALAAYNESRLIQFAKRPIFELLAGSTLQLPEKRQAFVSSMQLWLGGRLSMLVARQAGSGNNSFGPLFLKHLQSEVDGRFSNERSNMSGSGGAPMRDAQMEAFTGWFAYQMYILDDVEKVAIVHFVVERATCAILDRAAPALGDSVEAEYFRSEAHGKHVATGMTLLRSKSPKTYIRLRQIVGEAWDMVEAMTDRVVALTQSA